MFVHRLKSTAKYDIQPQALATCPNCPLAAISSNDSIVLFDINSPYEPQLIFHHSSSSSSSSQSDHKSSSNLLCFHPMNSPTSSDKPRYLAASHESSIFIYDTTGATLNPLLSRMSMPYLYKEPLRKLQWYDQDTVMSCSSSFIALWDIRESSSSSSSSSSSTGTTTSSNRPISLIHGKGCISVASFRGSSNHKAHSIAVLNADGIVSIFDERRTMATSDYNNISSSTSTSGSIVHQFKAHDLAFGIESFGDNWITWGMEKNKDTVIKVWNEEILNADHYWYMGTTTTSGEEDATHIHKEHRRVSTIDSNSPSNIGCSLEHKIENLMTVRPLPDSSEGFVTVSSPKQDSFGRHSASSMFQTDLWNITTGSSKANQMTPPQFTINSLASFESGDENDYFLMQMVGRDYLDGHLIGAELSRHDGELVLCGLNDKGFFTTHALPEASVLYKGEQNATSDKATTTKTSLFRYKMQPNATDHLKVYMDHNTETKPSQEFLYKSEGKRMKSPVLGDSDNFFQNVEGTGMQFDLDEENIEPMEPVLPLIIGSTIPANSDLEVEELNELTVSDEIDINKAARVPCPRLCGAVFGINGALITFNNGDVKNMWSWYTFGQVDTSSRKTELKPSIATLQEIGPLSNLEGEMKGSKTGMDSNGSSKQEFPKSFLDLLNVNKAAKVAQWGNEADDDGDDERSANGSGQLVSDTDESDDITISDDSSSSDSDDSLNYHDLHPQSNVEALYNSYFGNSLDVTNRKEQKKESKEEEEQIVQKLGRPRGESFALGPVTDTLVRKVYLTNAYSELSLHGQCPELADMWKFGAWDDESIDIHSKSVEEVAKLDEKEDGDVKEDKKESNPRIEILSAKIPSAVTRNRLGKVADICLHNAKCALEIGQHDKADVWNVIAEIVDNHASCAYDDFDRWFNSDGSALTSILLKNILNFYEKQGDFQMLATIITVLNAVKNASGDENAWVGNILPADEVRFDMYIRTYSALLYSWGKLSSRAELTKFLSSSKVHRVQRSDLEIIPFTPCCHSCNLKVNPSSNICTNCRGWAFLCSICTNSVRGVYTFCPICFHGGHTNHILSWFKENSICPTGCGCACVLASTEDETEESKNM